MASPRVATLPDIEGLLCDHVDLTDTPLQGLPIVGKLEPGVRLEEFLRVERTGGVRRSPVSDLPTVVVEAWAGDDARAAEILNEARTIFAALAGTRLGEYAVKYVNETGGVVRLPDPLSNQSRYTITFSIHIRGVLA